MTDEADRLIADLVRKKHRAKCRIGVIRAELRQAKETCTKLISILDDEQKFSGLDRSRQQQSIMIEGASHTNYSFDDIILLIQELQQQQQVVKDAKTELIGRLGQGT